MKFAFDDDQIAFRDAVRDLLAKECPPAAVRHPNRAAWDALAEMGVLSVLLPEAEGGLGLDERWLVLLLEEAGYAGLPHPIVETAAVAMPLLGSRIDAASVVTTDLGGSPVPFAMDADLLLLARGSSALAVVERADAKIEEIATVDPRRRGARVTWDEGVATEVDGDRDLAFDRGAWGTAALMVGLGQRMLDMTIDYVKEREQFGSPIGSFQAVKHQLADVALWLTFARPAVYHAAWSLATNDPARARDVSTAKSLASDAVEVAGRSALQCQGAIGYADEADLQLYLKPSWALSRAWGSAAWHRDRIGDTLDI